ncbi:hypothetical protein BDC45DRAFT_496752 [Circinella umbellata]|nr:hypothetical protein BDC45DRAFT_496752 [Circinella umbellata]
MTSSVPASINILQQQTIKTPEFTRRKNWSQSILDELRDIVLVINFEMMIVHCSAASRECLGYEPSELVNHRLTEFIHLDDVDSLKRNLRASKDTMEQLKVIFRLQGKDAKYNMVEMTGHVYKSCFFGTVRVTPVKATNTMEEFLELKMENEALKQKLHELQEQQTQHYLEEQQQQQQQDYNGEEGVTGFVMEESTVAPHVYTPGISTSYNIAETLSLFTGLNYEMGERSRGISMGLEGELLNISSQHINKFPTVVGPVDKEFAHEEPQRKSKKKRIEVEPQQYICTSCGTTDSPEWRKGPQGPKTFCNACGIKWRKTQKQQTEQRD